MGPKIAILLALGCSSSPLWALENAVVFAGTVEQNQLPLRFEITVLAGKSSQLVLADGSILVFTSAAKKGNSISSIRLYSAPGVQVSGSTVPGNAAQRDLVKFAVSNGRVSIDPSSKQIASRTPAG